MARCAKRNEQDRARRKKASDAAMDTLALHTVKGQPTAQQVEAQQQQTRHFTDSMEHKEHDLAMGLP